PKWFRNGESTDCAAEFAVESGNLSAAAACRLTDSLGREVWEGSMRSLWQDVRFGVRMLGRSPGLTAIAILALALGIGANTGIFSVVNAVLVRPLPYPDPERLVWFWEVQPNLPRAPFSAGDFLDFQARSQSFEQLAAMHSVNFTMTGRGAAERLPGMVVTPNFFTTLGVQPIVGRAFLPNE